MTRKLQDLGNLNCTFFAHRLDYDRTRNLQLVCDAINYNWGAGVNFGQRHDILCRGKKVNPVRLSKKC